MAKSPPPQELVQAYQFIKQGQPQQAAQLLKTYLKTNPQDAEAWWLMAHAVSKPEHVRKALETVLKCDPDHEKARRKLVKLDEAATGAADATAGSPAPVTTSPVTISTTLISQRTSPIEPVPPAAPPASVPKKPISSKLAALKSSPPSRPASASAPASPPSKPVSGPVSVPASFEDYEHSASAGDPFATPIEYDPFASVPSSGSAFSTPDTSSYNPFAASNVFDPSAAAHLRADSNSAQAAGTGNQPEWGPGLAFIREGEQPSVGARLDFGTADAEISRSSSYESLIGWALGAVAILVLIGLIAYFALNRDEKKVVAMETLNAATFTLSYPKGYDVQCTEESLGYQVCGIANHPMYNNVDLYVGNDVNLGNMLSEMLTSGLLGGSDLPDESVSIVVMDVPERSTAYDPSSWAKTKYEWSDEFTILTYDDVTYDKQNDPPRKVNGLDGYYYEYIARDSRWGRDIAYDIYIPHDGIMLWMTVSIQGAARGSDYRDTVEAMIDSIQIKPTDQWGS